jgi:hypothetical protein
MLKNDKNLGGQPVLASPHCKFWGIRRPVIYAHANMTPKNFFANIQTSKRYFLEKICVDCGIVVQLAIPVRAVGASKNKKK